MIRLNLRTAKRSRNFIGISLMLIATLFGNLIRAQMPQADDFNPGANNPVYAVAIQPDGKVLAAGSFSTLGGQTRYEIGRLTPEGAIDSAFNPEANQYIYSVSVQPDGKILLGGLFTTLNGQSSNRIGRINEDGSIDPTFDSIGANASVNCLVLQADGKILAGGSFSTLDGQSRANIGRLNANGTIDNEFNPGANGTISSIALQADGKILVGGSFTSLGGESRTNIGRLNADGSVDPTFNTGATSTIHCFAVQADGKILVGGLFTTLDGQSRTNIGRLNADGTIDSTFNPGASSTVYSIVLQADGKILVGGSFTTLAGQSRMNIGRLNEDGTIDSTFEASASSTVYALALQPDGKILAGGNFTTLGGQSRSRIGRLNNPTPATQNLTFDGSTLTWLRDGSSPEIWRASFESWDGTSWTALWEGTRINDCWQLSGSPELSEKTIRARGYTAGGYRNGSGWFVEAGLGPILITRQPASRTNQFGSTANFSVAPLGTDPMTYQWCKDGTSLVNGGSVAGANTPALTLTNVSGANVGGYTVVISNTFGTVTSVVASLTVVDPRIYISPLSQSGNAGGTVTFRVTAKGTSPLSYQWRKEGVALDGASNSTLALTNLMGMDSGSYDVVVTNVYGAVTSAVAVLTVNIAAESSFDPGVNDGAYAFAERANGKVLVGGGFSTLEGKNCSKIGQLNGDGTVDSTFDPTASKSLSSLIQMSLTFVNALAVQTNGKIVAGGAFTFLGRQSRTNLGRLNPDGSVDATFTVRAETNVNCLAIQADGKILVGGAFFELGGLGRSHIGRLNTDGTVDTSFNPGVNGTVNSLAVQPDGKILVGGSFTILRGQSRTNIGRLNPDGSLDSTFNPGANNGILCIALQRDGNILLGGYFTTLGGQSRKYLGRVNPDGSIDTAFTQGASNAVCSLVVQTDGKILAGGDDYITRYDADGTLDALITTSGGWVSSLAIQTDGKILTGGFFTNVGGIDRYHIARLNNTEAASQSLTLNGDAITWLRGGTSPEVWRTIFEFWDGTVWTPLGEGSRIPDGWQLTGVPPISDKTVRARGYTTGGKFNGSAWFVETVTGLPVITTQPANSTNNFGSTASFNVEAFGTGPLSYHWFKNGVPLIDGERINGAHSNILTIANAEMSDGGLYSVMVTNAVGAITSSNALLTVRQPVPPPAFVPGAISLQPGGLLTLGIQAELNSQIEISTSTNLTNWTVLTTLTNLTGTVSFTNPVNDAARFYRARAK